jgi:hypothetical protein
MTLRLGARIWVPCEVKTGPFPDERVVRVTSAAGDAVAFVPTALLAKPIEEGKTYVRTVVVDVRDQEFTSRLPGDSLGSGTFHGDLAGVRDHGPIET